MDVGVLLSLDTHLHGSEDLLLIIISIIILSIFLYSVECTIFFVIAYKPCRDLIHRIIILHIIIIFIQDCMSVFEHSRDGAEAISSATEDLVEEFPL